MHASGERYTTGAITKAGRRELRSAMVEAANAAVRHHVFWKKQFERLEYRLGRSRAVVAIARKLLITVWHVLMEEIVDRHHDSRDIACSLFKLAYDVKVRNLREHGLKEGASTRVLIYAGRLIKEGIAPRRACQVAVTWGITDDPQVQRSLAEVGLAIREDLGTQLTGQAGPIQQ